MGKTFSLVLRVTLLACLAFSVATDNQGNETNSAPAPDTIGMEFSQEGPPYLQATADCLCPECDAPVSNAVNALVDAASSHRNRMEARLDWMQRNPPFMTRAQNLTQLHQFSSGFSKVTLHHKLTHAFALNQLPRPSYSNCDGFFEKLTNYITQYMDLLSVYDELLYMCDSGKINPTFLSIHTYAAAGIGACLGVLDSPTHPNSDNCTKQYNQLEVFCLYKNYTLIVLIANPAPANNPSGFDFFNFFVKCLIITIAIAMIIFMAAICFFILPCRKKESNVTPVIYWEPNQINFTPSNNWETTQ